MTPAFSYGRSEAGILEETNDAIGQRFGIAWWDEKTRLSVGNHIGNRTGGCRHDRETNR